MRIIVVSDTHGNYNVLEGIIEKNLSAEIFVHLGDGEKELDEMVTRYSNKDFRHVAGNCDYASLSPSVMIICAGEHRILATHGNRHNVKYSLEDLKKTAKENNANIVIFGHTHARLQTYEDGIYFLNPGSASVPRDGNKPSYVFIDITGAGVLTNIVNID